MIIIVLLECWVHKGYRFYLGKVSLWRNNLTLSFKYEIDNTLKIRNQKYWNKNEFIL